MKDDHMRAAPAEARERLIEALRDAEEYDIDAGNAPRVPLARREK